VIVFELKNDGKYLCGLRIYEQSAERRGGGRAGWGATHRHFNTSMECCEVQISLVVSLMVSMDNKSSKHNGRYKTYLEASSIPGKNDLLTIS